MDVRGDVDNAGTLQLNTGEISLDGDWTNNLGSFISGTGTVILNSTTNQQSVLTGGSSSAFYVLDVLNSHSSGVAFTDELYCDTLNATTGVKKLSFETGGFHTISSTFNVNGSSGNYITLAPLTPLTNWYLNTPTTIVDYLNVSHSQEIDGDVIYACNSIDSGNNTNWLFVNCSGGNATPVADAGPDQSVFVGDPVTLDGSGSWDANGDQLSFNWSFTSQPAGSTASLVIDPLDPAHPAFTVDKAGDYVVSLTVNDGIIDSDPDTVTISTLNSAPVANAGPDQSVFVNDLVTLDGSGSSDVDGDSLTFNWSFTSKPVDSTATLVVNPSDPAHPTFTVDKSGDYVVSLTVNDSTVDSTPDEVKISTLNSAPIADAGGDQSVFVGDTVVLNGGNSWDVDGDGLTYSWAFTQRPAGSTANLLNPTSVNPTFTVDVAGTYVVSLVVNDSSVDSAPDTVSISTINVAPVADAGNDDSVFVGDIVVLDGSGSSDPDNNPLTYSWSFTSIPATSSATLANPDTPNPSFTADAAGTYIISLIVNDGSVNSDPSMVTITAVTQSTATITKVQESIDEINLLDPNSGVFKNPNNQKALTSKLNTVIDKLDNGEYQDALNKLENDILKKMDGCALTGSPDKNDWIKDCPTQALIYPLVLEAIQLLSQL